MEGDTKVKKIIIVTLFLLVATVFSFNSCDDANVPNDNLNEPSDTENNTSDDSKEEVEDKYRNLKAFIEEYNNVAKTDIKNTVEIDIQSPEYYRTEFRLPAYQGAPAYKGYIGTNAIEIINSNYDGIFGSDLRIYVVVDTLEEATEIFEAFCKACDPDITQSDFDDFYKYYSLDNKNGCSISIGDIGGFVHLKSDGFNIMLDADPDFFD